MSALNGRETVQKPIDDLNVKIVSMGLDREHPCYKLHEDLQVAHGERLKALADLIKAERENEPEEIERRQNALNTANTHHASISGLYAECEEKHGTTSL
jgi:hypothetical protein